MRNIQEINRIKTLYPAGTRIRLGHMEDPQAVPDGTFGTVNFVDDMGTIHMKWDNGSSLGICPKVDKFEVIEPFCVEKLFRTEGEKETQITCYPINDRSVEIPSLNINNFYYFQIIENDPDKDYGYTEIIDCGDGFRAECYRHWLPIPECEPFEEAVDRMWKCPNYSTINDAIKQHLDWWLSNEDVPDKIPIFKLTDSETKSLLDNGFIGKRIFIS